MPLPVLEMQKTHLLGLRAEQLDALLRGWGWPDFRANQLREWVYSRQVSDPAAMTNLRKGQRDAIANHFTITPAAITSHQRSADGTQKLLLTWPDGSNAETVMIPDGQRRTACVSSQVGCPVGCTFCASGIEGVKGNLSAGQIVEQVYRLNQILSATEGKAGSSRPGISNVVFMGMGEPLANYANVMQAVRVLHDPRCMNMGARRITISTVGVPPKMRDLAEEELPINLAISLHAPNEPLRRQLIPWAEHFPLDDILDAARYYFERTGREITLEYILLAGVNDRPEHARQLAQVTRTMRANVNLIRYNEVSSLPYKRPAAQDVVAFQEILRHNGVNAHVRKSRGRDIEAACGQLRRKEMEKSVVQR